MKKIIVFLSLFLMMSSPVMAFLYQVKILTREEIKVLKKEVLVEVYIEAKIETNASRTFHGKAGFNPKEYVKYKDLLGFIVRLRQEMQAREMEAPPVDEWLR